MAQTTPTASAPTIAPTAHVEQATRSGRRSAPANPRSRRLDTGLQLAEDTRMCFYDAELLRLRVHTTPTWPPARPTAPRELACRQGATVFELRAALDDYELRGEPLRAARAPRRR